MRLVDDLLATVGAVILTRGLLEMPEPLCTLAHHVAPTPEPVAGGPQGGRIHGGLGPPAPTAPDGNRLRLERSVLGLAPVEGCPVERLPEDKRQPRPSAQVGPPDPRGRGLRRRRPGRPARAQ
jgi:hypothetical protein